MILELVRLYLHNVSVVHGIASFFTPSFFPAKGNFNLSHFAQRKKIFASADEVGQFLLIYSTLLNTHMICTASLLECTVEELTFLPEAVMEKLRWLFL